jgi:hypothetical protein
MVVVLDVLLLLVIANGAPILGHRILGERLGHPIDAGLHLADGQPLFGLSKTWRGAICAVVLTTLAAALLGYPVWLGALAGAAAMTGDLLSSFIKRRRRLPPSSFAAGVDQIPEALLPALLLMPLLGLRPGEVVLIVAAFVAVELALSVLLYMLKIRRQPY